MNVDEQREGDGVVGHAPEPREPQDARDAERADHLDRRVEDGLGVDGALVRVPVPRVDLVELRGHRRLADERLHHGDPAHLLVQEGVEPRRPRPDVAVGGARLAADVVDDEPHDRERQERNDGQLPVEQDHHRDDADEGYEIAHRVERA